MAFQFKCAYCGQTITGSNAEIGSKGVCPGCNKLLLVPAPSPRAQTLFIPPPRSRRNPLLTPLLVIAALLVAVVSGGFVYFYLNQSRKSQEAPASQRPLLPNPRKQILYGTHPAQGDSF